MLAHRTDAASCIHAVCVKCNTLKSHATVVAVNNVSVRLKHEQLEERATTWKEKQLK